VTVAEIARVADVSEKTVFNYFPTKEDLVYWRLESFEEELLGTLRDRAAGESVLAAFVRFVKQPRGMLGEHDPATQERLAALTRMIVESPSLLRREQQIFEGYTASLATLLAEETGARADDVEAWVAATALIGVHRRLVDFARGQIVAGARQPEIADAIRDQADRALALLDNGLGDYAVKEP
jgi:AcrR family transcriptional regulator